MDRRWAWTLCIAVAVGCGDELEDIGSGSMTDQDQDLGAADAGTDVPPDGGTTDDAGQDAGASDVDADDMGSGFVPEVFGEWIQRSPEGTFCADGSPYKYYVKFSETSDDLIVFFEGGGACWDYRSCTGSGVRSAANRDGLPDDYVSELTRLMGIPISADVVYPLLNDDEDVSPMADWNKVFMPYCTGDVFAGDSVVEYADPAGIEPDLEFHHVGHRNVLVVLDELRMMLPQVDRLFVGGCSAGGAGATNNYHALRSGLDVRQGYLLNDSGPIFPDQAPGAWSLPLHDRVRQAWNIDTLVSELPMSTVVDQDYGAVNRVLSDAFPSDRLAQTFFRLDYNFSLFSYERFYERNAMGEAVPFMDGSGTFGVGLDEFDPEDRAIIYRLWSEDTQLLRDQHAMPPNLGYFMPYYRKTNDSHCTSVVGAEEFPAAQLLSLFLTDFATLAWAGSDLMSGEESINLRDYVDRLLDDETPIPRLFESTPEGPFVPCTPEAFDPDACALASD
jgi:hypothetical protein